jgi:integrating conjugative element protein (TIGR03765 family)
MIRANPLLIFSVWLSAFALPTVAADTDLIVVHDGGGVSALPYYRALNLKARKSDHTGTSPAPAVPVPPTARYSEADLLPVHSTRLTPGAVTRRAIHVPGLTPIFLIGDDARSRAWLREHLGKLRALRAVGFVVQVESEEALRSLRRLAANLQLVPASGDDLAQRLDLHHYPVLITATAIEP